MQVYSDNSSLESTQKIITPLMTANTQDPQSWTSDMNSQEVAGQLNQRLLDLVDRDASSHSVSEYGNPNDEAMDEGPQDGTHAEQLMPVAPFDP